MKRTLLIATMLMLCFALHAQGQVTTFLGIPVDGTKTAMIQKLQAKGFRYDKEGDWLKGEFNDKDVLLRVVTRNNKVCRIYVMDKHATDEAGIKIRFNLLCQQFKANTKYVSYEDYRIPENENISYQMRVNKKRYDAAYFQLPIDDNIGNRLVWFQIDEDYGKFRIVIFYDNENNRSNGDDL